MDQPWLPDWVDSSRIGSGAAPDLGFDEFLNLSDADQHRAYAALSNALFAGRRRRPTAKARESYQRVLGCVIANAIVAMEKGPRTYIHYSRAKTAYVGGDSPYHPSWLSSKLLLRTVDALKAAGLLKATTAVAGPFAGQGRQRSTYEATVTLRAALEGLGISAASVARNNDEAPVIYLRGADKTLQWYDPAAGEVATKASLLRAYNAWIDGQPISLDLREGASLATQPDLAAKHLVRIFTRSLEEHGRFYGGWWQNVPKDARRYITISEEQTVELDFQGLVARMLYHQQGLEFDGDPYAISEIMAAAEQDGLAWKDVRPVVKQAFNFMLNAKKRGGYDQSRAFDGWPPSLSKKEGVAAIERFHSPIRHRFFKQEALRLMNRDAQICEQILEAGLIDSVVVLPIHDSFIVAEKHQCWLIDQMMSAYRKIIGFEPVIA